MSYLGNGVFSINSAGQPVVNGTTISSTAFNALTADLAVGLSNVICKDGQSTPTANIPMGSWKLTGLAPATTLGDALSYGQAATVTTLGASTITATGAINGNSTSGFATSFAGQNNNFTTGGVFSTQAVTVQAVSAGVILNAAATAWASASDERLKTHLTPFGDALGKVASLRSGTGRYLTDDDSKSRSFLIAQDVQKVLPEAVDDPGEDGMLSLRYSEVIPLLVAALTEAKARIEALEAK